MSKELRVITYIHGVISWLALVIFSGMFAFRRFGPTVVDSMETQIIEDWMYIPYFSVLFLVALFVCCLDLGKRSAWSLFLGIVNFCILYAIPLMFFGTIFQEDLYIFTEVINGKAYFVPMEALVSLATWFGIGALFLSVELTMPLKGSLTR